MSLDVHLTIKGVQDIAGPHIFIREGGAMKEISREGEVFWSNITHNLNQMAAAAGIYEHLWRPDEIGVTKAAQLIEPLRSGLEKLRASPDTFKAFNPSNGWGDYEGLVEFVATYLAACEEHPEAEVSVSR